MRIVIVGDGKVGAALTEYLSKEGHDIVVIDNRPDVIGRVVAEHDVMGINGNGACYDVQMEAGVEKANLLIAATSSDELNILCCLVANKIGAKHTIARVRNPEYTKQLSFMHGELGLSMVVNPELEAANEIYRSIRFPSAIKIELFAKGRIEMAEFIVEEKSPIKGMSLSQIDDTYHLDLLVCVVQRGEEVHIPDGSFIVHTGDRIHVTASRPELNAFLKIMGTYRHGGRNIMIIGGGKIAYYLAKQLSEQNAQVKIIEQQEKRCQELSDSLPNVLVIHGDGSDQKLLHDEGIGQMDVCVALTGIDEENIIISLYASTQHVPKNIVKINRETLSGILTFIGTDTIVSPKNLTANRILCYVRAMEASPSSRINSLYKIVGGKAEALEFYIQEQTRYVGIQLKDLELKPETLIASIIRNNKVIFPRGNDSIEVGDTLIIVTKSSHISSMEDIFL